MNISTAEDIYEDLIKQLPVNERLRLVEKIARDLSAPLSEPIQKFEWQSIRGIAPDLLDGTDAQDWVSSTRHAADKDREAQWRKSS